MNSDETLSLMDTLDEIMAANAGQTIEEHCESKAIREALMPKATQIKGTPPSEWPKLKFNWDLSLEGRQYSFDPFNSLSSARDIEKWKLEFEDLKLGWVKLKEMDRHLCFFSRRDGIEELWNLGNSSNLAFVIAYISDGLPISPPVVEPHSEGGVILSGGHHRYAAAKAVEEEKIPIYCRPEHRNKISNLFSIEWVKQ
ncbi:MAG: transcriptional regulator [Candidatus Electrothrix sp. GM3_4]|nr:transcriptional regulator [Candidatus Electrothrix sp. GM3_4]